VDGHQPQDVDAQLLEARQLLLGGAEGAFGRELAGVDLVDAGVTGPLGILKVDIGLRLIRIGGGCGTGGAGGGSGHQRKQEEFDHVGQ
jgi:hypothetical protein